MNATLARPDGFRSPQLRRRFAAFSLLTSGIYAVAAHLSSSLESIAGADAAWVAWGLTLDLVVVVPSLYWFLVVRAGGPRLPVIPITVLSLAAAGAIVPSQYHQALGALELVAFPLEITFVGFLFWKVHRLVTGAHGAVDVSAELRRMTGKMLGEGRVSKIVASEATVFYFALAAWRRRAPETGVGELRVTHDRLALYNTFFWGILIAAVAELVGVHFLVMRWSEAAAWVLSALSLYGLAWLVGDFRAVRLQPSSVARGVFSFRLGLRWSVDIDISNIARVQALTPAQRSEIRDRQDVLSAVLMGEPNRLLVLKEPVTVEGLYGMTRRVDRIALTIDDPAAFEAAVS
ncbi:MAG: hypothetical protein AAGM22_11345 [Acidobacteriota bacterium]